MKYRFNDPESPNEIIQRAWADQFAAEATIAGFQKDPEKCAHDWAPTSCAAMLRKVDSVLANLQTPGDERLAAAGLVLAYWPRLGEFVEPCLTLAFSDLRPKVRGVALKALKRLYGWVDDPTGLLGRILWCPPVSASIE